VSQLERHQFFQRSAVTNKAVYFPFRIPLGRPWRFHVANSELSAFSSDWSISGERGGQGISLFKAVRSRKRFWRRFEICSAPGTLARETTWSSQTMKENIAESVNASSGASPCKLPTGRKKVKFQGGSGSSGGRVNELKKMVPGQPCSPVREEEVMDGEEEFTSDVSALNQKFSKDKTRRMLVESAEDKRRQTLASSEGLENRGLRRRISIGGKNRRMSLGGASNNSKPGDNHHVNHLIDELNKREKLDYTRQQRLNGMDIKLKELNAKHHNLQQQCKEQKKERDELMRQVNELKRKNKQLMASKRRLEMNSKHQEETIKKLLAKVGGRRTGNLKETASFSNKAGIPAGADTGPPIDPAVDEDDESFGDATEILSKSISSGKSALNPRRYTMAPGEISRARRGSKITNSHFIRIDGLEEGTNSHKLLALCKEYGDIAQLRVTSDVVTGILKGYVTFLDTSYADDAVRALCEKGFKACLTDKA